MNKIIIRCVQMSPTLARPGVFQTHTLWWCVCAQCVVLEVCGVCLYRIASAWYWLPVATCLAAMMT